MSGLRVVTARGLLFAWLSSNIRFRFYNREVEMKPEIHPEYKQISVTCSCGNTFETGSTANKDLSIEVCSSCHPFYTGKQKVMDTAGQVDKFRRRYGSK